MTGNNQAMSVAQVRAVVNQFFANYSGNIPLTPVIKAHQEDLYGTELSEAAVGFKIEGAYHPSRSIFTLAASNLRELSEVERVVRHEILGHYGLNTFKPREKNALLLQISKTENERSLKPIWDRVKASYKDMAPAVQAEEVFAFVAEEERTFFGRSWDKVRASFQEALRSVGLASETLTLAELRVAAADVAKGIRQGTRHQQTFPTTDHLVTPGQGRTLPLGRKEIKAAAKAAEGLAHQELLRNGSTPDTDDLILQSSAILVPRFFNGEQIGWDCELYEPGTLTEVGAIRVFPSGFVVEQVLHDDRVAWRESTTLSVDSLEARKHLDAVVADVTTAPSTKELSFYDVSCLEQNGWRVALGRKLPNTNDPSAYLDMQGGGRVATKAGSDVINVTVLDEKGEPVQAVAWYDKAQHLRSSINYGSRLPEAMQETAQALYLYVEAGCSDDVQTQADQLKLGQELFNMLSPHQQDQLRQHGVRALDDVLVQFTGDHGSERPGSNRMGPAPGQG